MSESKPHRSLSDAQDGPPFWNLHCREPYVDFAIYCLKPNQHYCMWIWSQVSWKMRRRWPWCLAWWFAWILTWLHRNQCQKLSEAWTATYVLRNARLNLMNARFKATQLRFHHLFNDWDASGFWIISSSKDEALLHNVHIVGKENVWRVERTALGSGGAIWRRGRGKEGRIEMKNILLPFYILLRESWSTSTQHNHNH